MSAKTPHDVGPQADLALEIERATQGHLSPGSLVSVPKGTLLQAIEYLRSLRGEGVAEGEARAQRALDAAQERMTRAIGVVGWLEAHDETGKHRAVNRSLRDALGLPGRMTITCPCPQHTKAEQ